MYAQLHACMDVCRYVPGVHVKSGYLERGKGNVI